MFQTLRLMLAKWLLPEGYDVRPSRSRYSLRQISDDLRHVSVDHLRAGSHIRKRFLRIADELMKAIGVGGAVTLD